MNIESQLYEQRLINSSLNLPQLPKNAWDSPLQEIQMTAKIWIYGGNLNLASRSNSAVDCFCWMWKVWLALCGNHTVAKAPAEVGQSKIATADTKWKKKNQTSKWIPWDGMKQEGRASRHALQCKHRLCTLLSAATTTTLARWDLVGTTVPSVTLRYQSLQYTSDTFKFWREIGLCTVAMIWVRVARLGNVGLPYQRVNMIALGLELSTSQHLWPSGMGWRLLCKCNWLQKEVTLLKMYQ